MGCPSRGIAHFDIDSVECSVVTSTTFFIPYLCAANKPLGFLNLVRRETGKGICFSSIRIGIAMTAIGLNVIVFARRTPRPTTTVIVEFPTLKTFRGIMSALIDWWLHSFPVTPFTFVDNLRLVFEEIVCDIFVSCNLSFQCF